MLTWCLSIVCTFSFISPQVSMTVPVTTALLSSLWLNFSLPFPFQLQETKYQLTSSLRLLILCDNWTWYVHLQPNSSDRSNISSVIWLLFNCFRMGLIIKTLLALYCEWCVTVSSRKLEWVSIQSVTMSRWPPYGKCLDTRPEKQASWVALGAASKVIFISRL